MALRLLLVLVVSFFVVVTVAAQVDPSEGPVAGPADETTQQAVVESVPATTCPAPPETDVPQGGDLLPQDPGVSDSGDQPSVSPDSAGPDGQRAFDEGGSQASGSAADGDVTVQAQSFDEDPPAEPDTTPQDGASDAPPADPSACAGDASTPTPAPTPTNTPVPSTPTPTLLPTATPDISASESETPIVTEPETPARAMIVSATPMATSTTRPTLTPSVTPTRLGQATATPVLSSSGGGYSGGSGLSFGAPSSGGAPSSPTPEPTMGPVAGSWNGMTSQGKAVTFSVEAGQVRSFSMGWSVGGCAPAQGQLDAPGPFPINSNEAKIVAMPTGAGLTIITVNIAFSSAVPSTASGDAGVQVIGSLDPQSIQQQTCSSANPPITFTANSAAHP